MLSLTHETIDSTPPLSATFTASPQVPWQAVVVWTIAHSSSVPHPLAASTAAAIVASPLVCMLSRVASRHSPPPQGSKVPGWQPSTVLA